jgi:hypothetical protein
MDCWANIKRPKIIFFSKPLSFCYELNILKGQRVSRGLILMMPNEKYQTATLSKGRTIPWKKYDLLSVLFLMSDKKITINFH